MKIVLIPCGATEWHAERRLLGRVELELSPSGTEACQSWIPALSELNLQRILHAPDNLATQTAATIARPLSIPTKACDDLREVDVGLWAGLTEAQLETRFATAHRELKDAPLNVAPPGGEKMTDATDRLTACLRKQTRRNGKGAVGVVLRPISFTMVHSALEGRELTDMWVGLRSIEHPITVDLPPKKTPAGTT